jgi:hypothetical protein
VGDASARGNSLAATLLSAIITPNAQSLTAGAGTQNKPSNATYLNSGSNLKSIGVKQQKIAPVCYTDSLFLIISDYSYLYFLSLYIVTSIGKHLSANCQVCDELCECDIDSILFCKPCNTLFHTLCTTTKHDLTKLNALRAWAYLVSKWSTPGIPLPTAEMAANLRTHRHRQRCRLPART